MKKKKINSESNLIQKNQKKIESTSKYFLKDKISIDSNGCLELSLKKKTSKFETQNLLQILCYSNLYPDVVNESDDILKSKEEFKNFIIHTDDNFKYSFKSFRFTIENPQVIYELFRSKFVNKFLLHKNFKVLELSDEEIQGVVNLSNSGISICQKIKKHNLVITNFTNEFLLLIESLISSSFAGILQVPAHKLVNKKETYYNLATDAIKHRGLYLMVIYEFINFCLYKKSSDGELIESEGAILKKVIKQFYSLGFSILREQFLNKLKKQFKDSDSEEAMQNEMKYFDGLRDEDIFPTHLRHILSDTLVEIINLSKGSVGFLVAEGMLDMRRINILPLEVLRSYIEREINVSKGKVFLKGLKLDKDSKKNNHDSRQISTLPYDVEFDHAKSIFPLGRAESATLFSFLKISQQCRFEILIDSRKVELLTSEEFNVTMRVVDLKDDRDWFELNPVVFLKGQKIDIHEIGFESNSNSLGIMFYRGSYYYVPIRSLTSTRLLNLFWEKIKNINKKTSDLIKPNLNNNENKIYHLPRHAVLDLLILKAKGINVQGSKTWETIESYFEHLLLGKSQNFKYSELIESFIKPYQRIGAQWFYDLYKINLGGILADDMGLGKTLQALIFLDRLRLENELGMCLVIVPTTLTYNWLTESKKWVPQLDISFEHPAKVKSYLVEQKVYILSYGLFSENIEILSQYNWNIILFDEAQNLKNLSTQRTTAARQLKARRKFCLTGTPIENNLLNLYSMIDLCVPGYLGGLTQFRTRYVSTLDLESVEYKSKLSLLKERISPLLLRRTKTEVLLDLPEKTEATIKIQFEKSQQEIYKKIATAQNEQVLNLVSKKGEMASQLAMFTALLRLRQVCSDPEMIPNVKYSKTPPKLDEIVKQTLEILEVGNSVLIFTQFLKTQDRLEKLFEQYKVKSLSICGATSKEKRILILKEFNESPKAQVLIMTLKTGGVGLNLTKASFVFHVDPWWNPAVENQASDRAHRLGQTQKVTIYKYIMQNSLEEKIEDLKSFKSQLAKVMLDEEANLNFAGQIKYEVFKKLIL